ncbi:MAG: cell envelope integrity protein TolA, partial [Thermodesulfobacteriota bacterium]
EEEKTRKAEEEKKKREQILKDALKAAADEAKKKEKSDAASVQKELDALRKQVTSGSGPAATAAQPGSGSGGGGGPAGSTGTGIGSIAAYGRVVEQIIKANWRFPSATAANALVTQIEIRIAVDGSISGYRMLGASGRPDYDASAVRAIQDTKALPPPPSPDLSVLIINFNNQE